MEIINYDVYMRKGDTEAVNVNVTGVDGEKVDLVDGDIIHLTIKLRDSDTNKILQKSVTEFVNGEALITIYPEDTKELDIRSYVYDIQLTRGNRYIKTIVPPLATDPLPKWVIRPEVTYE